MKGFLISVNVGLPKDVETPRGMVRTGIFKSPADVRVRAVPHNLEGDRQADLSAHGGVNKAVYAYPIEHYATWQQELDRDDFTHGQFGENLTTQGLLETELGIGDVLTMGAATLAVTQPRSPCFKLGIRMADPRIVKRFMKSGRPGFYLSVVEPGDIGRGDQVSRIERGPSGLSVRDIWNLSYGADHDPDRLARALTLDTLGEEWLRPMRSRLAR